MVTRLRKVRRQRGSRAHGWGQIGQHRRTGAKGGSGMAGLHKHKWSYTVKYAPDHFGHNQFSPPNKVRINRWLNISDIPALAADRKQELDLGALGFDKLLGEGTPDGAYNIKVPRASARAVEKIKASGGSVVLEFVPEEKSVKNEKTPKKA